MADETFVGFAKSPKIDSALQRCQVSNTMHSQQEIETVFRTVTSSEGLSKWLIETLATDVRTSGKVRFRHDDENLSKAVFSHIDLGRQVVLNSEMFGELVVNLARKRDQVTVQVSFTKMVLPTEFNSFQNLVNESLALLARELSDQK